MKLLKGGICNFNHFSKSKDGQVTMSQIASRRPAMAWIALLFVLLLAQGVSCEESLVRRGLPTLTTTTASAAPSSAEPSSAEPTSYSNSTTSSTQSPSATFVPVIPSSGENKYVYHTKHTGGTVFIAVGSCLAFILVVLIGVWMVFGVGAWHSARKEYKLKEMEEKYQYDPFFFESGNDTAGLSDSDEGSDISEKVLKNKSSRLSLYSLGSTSVLNLLNQPKNDTADPSTNMNNNRRSMFISPTEILQTEANKNTLWAGDSPATNLFDSPASTPLEQSYAQIIGSNAGPHVAQPQVSHYTDSTPAAQSNSNTKTNYRPPSVVLDQLLDDEDPQV